MQTGHAGKGRAAAHSCCHCIQGSRSWLARYVHAQRCRPVERSLIPLLPPRQVTPTRNSDACARMKEFYCAVGRVYASDGAEAAVAL